MLRFGSLFSGIGGLDLGLERAGMQCVWQSEIEPYACQVLAKHWPAVTNLGDIRDIDWTTVDTVDVICGGYPCQPFSAAGERKGTDDPRHLWPMFARAIRHLRPKYALLENVAAHLSLGFGQVLSDLAALGYDAEWDCIPAAALGAPHLRDRLFVIGTRRELVADTAGASGQGGRTPGGRPAQHPEPDLAGNPWPSPIADTAKLRPPRSRRTEYPSDTTPSGQRQTNQLVDDCYWRVESQVGRVAYGVPNRVDRLRGLGNAVVPQVAEHIGNIIKNMEANT